MIQPLGQDVVKPDGNIAGKRLPRGLLSAARKQNFGAFRATVQITGIGVFDPLLTQDQRARPIGP